MEINPKLGNVNYEIQVHNDFYFYFIALTRIEFNESVQTAGLKLEGIDFKISINPKFWNSISDHQYKKNQFLLLHEIYHLILKHYSVYKDYDDVALFNIATDCYINYELINIVFKSKSYFIEGGVWFEDIGVPMEVVIKGSDEIYRYLKTSSNENFKELYNQCKNQNVKTIIDHDLWKELSDSEIPSEILEKAINSQVESLLKEVNNYAKNQGTIPASIKRILDQILEKRESKINWKKELGKFISLFSNKIFVKKSFTKPSKFFDDATTFKIKFKPKIAVIVDSSSSMSNNDIVECFSEIINISKKLDYDIKIIECDANVTKDSVYDYKNVKTIINKISKKGVIGGGGTMVDPAIKYINQSATDVACIVYITDGYVSKPKINPLKPMIILLVSKGMDVNSFRKNWSNKFKILKIDEV